MLVEPAILYELRQNVFGLTPGKRRRVKLFQKLMQIRTATFRLLNRPQNFFLRDLRLPALPPPPRSWYSSTHEISLLTSVVEEHRFGSLVPKWRNWQTR